MTHPQTSAPTVRYVEVSAAHEGQRLDNFLIGTLKGVPRTHIYRLLRTGQVRINRARARPDYRLQTGDVVRIPPVRATQASKRHPERFDWLEERVLHEDDDLLVIDKPPGVAVHAGTGVAVGLIEGLRGARPHAPMLELVHRLDRETSGCLLVAKSRAALVALHRQWREGGVEKTYLALLQGSFHGTRTVQAALERGRVRSGERLVAVDQRGKQAKSRFVSRRRHGPATLVEIRLLTGRTHQARVHAAHLGHPIAGDEKYGNRDFNRDMRHAGLRRLFLHAARLRFVHPVRGSKIAVEAPLPLDLKSVLERLGP